MPASPRCCIRRSMSERTTVLRGRKVLGDAGVSENTPADPRPGGGFTGATIARRTRGKEEHFDGRDGTFCTDHGPPGRRTGAALSALLRHAEPRAPARHGHA